jgi:hypothetical protein
VNATLLLLALARAPQQDAPEIAGASSAPAPAPTAPATPATLPRVDRAFTLDELELSFRALAAGRPRFARETSLGQSRGGRDLYVLELGDHEAGDLGERPGILLAGYGPAAGAFAAETILGVARALLEGDDAAIAARLAGVSVYLAPALDPDTRVEGAPRPEIRFDRNFPYGWQPRTVRAGSGAYPLAIPEALALVRFLEQHANLSLIVGFVPRPERAGPPWKEAELPEADRSVLASLAGKADPEGEGSLLLAWSDLASPGGGPLDHAFQGLGVYPCAFSYPGPGAEGLEAHIGRVVEGVRGLMARLPRLGLETEGLVELAPGLWQLDVAVRNEGRLPTLSQIGERLRGGPSFRVSMEGAKLVATAHRSAA